MAVGTAFRAFFAALFNAEVSQRIDQALSAAPTPTEPVERPKAIEKSKPTRSEALTLLSTLQREARLLDLVQESLDGFEDAQIGAAAREVLRDCRKTLDRMFSIEAAAEADEGEQMPVADGASPNQIKVSGGSGQQSGVVVHRGWKATRCEIPKWSGQRDDAWVLAPIEIDVSNQ